MNKTFFHFLLQGPKIIVFRIYVRNNHPRWQLYFQAQVLGLCSWLFFSSKAAFTSIQIANGNIGG